MKSLWRVLPFVRPYWLIAIFMFVTSILPVAMELLVPWLLRQIIDGGILTGDLGAIVRSSAWMLAAAVVGAAATLGQGFCRARLSQGLAYDLRNRLFAHVQTFSFANLDQMHTGQLMTRLSSDVDMVRLFMSAGLSLLLRALLMITGAVTLMAAIDSRLTLVMALLLPLAALLLWSIMRLAQPLFVIVQEKLAALNVTVQENLAGARVVKAYVRERFESDRFRRFNLDYRDRHIAVGRLLAAALPVLTILTNLGLVAVIWFGGRDAIAGGLSVGNLVAFSNYVLIGMAPLMLLGNILTMISRADASAGRLWEILDTIPAVQAVPAPYRRPGLRGEVAFEKVAFRYNGGHRGGRQRVDSDRGRGSQDVLQGVSFTAEPGQRVALLGATGSGKTSLVNLIPRFYDAHQGMIRIDGVDVRQWDPDALRRRIGVVLQQTTLFSGTIRENIAFGRPDAPLGEVIAAARAAQAHNFIMALPQGYDSLLEERGANLSGGQKQRLAIARALLITPDILILDDSTSAVDLETEARIQAALETRARPATTFIIAQRISSVTHADQILVLDRGRIVAQGTHQELLRRSPIYQEIVASQRANGTGGN